jgi:glycosyltransferase involved in cell wall biosynthesis
MKILFLSTSDIAGGASVAAYRLFCSLENLGENVSMEVQYKYSDHPKINGPAGLIARASALARRPTESFLVRRSYPACADGTFMPARLPDGLRRRIKEQKPDLIHLHWVGHSFLRPETLEELEIPLLWTLHDMWPLTGGCYYDNNCGRYELNCGGCPVLNSKSNKDLSLEVWRRKSLAWRNLGLTLVSPSKWLAQCAAKSSLHKHRRIETIPYGINTSIFQPWQQDLARQMLGLPRNKILLLFGASGSLKNPRKGFADLVEALSQFAATNTTGNVELVVFGSYIPPEVATKIPIKSRSLGFLRDEITLALAYSAADIFIAPSIEDNFPNTTIEAASCGRPVVAYDAGGLPEIVQDNVTGIVVKKGDRGMLRAAVESLISRKELRQTLGFNARQRAVAEFDLSLQASRYISLYQDISSR